ncbi:uncharacterized protein [Primulina huaijiensis]|uniref:uncharacterized protein isoform X3 n=1 Tax=Primulina huaijiensis TaxID=1492673 RepID=UPI003CC73068
MLDKKLEEILSVKRPDDAPAAPVYGFNEDAEEEESPVDEMAAIARVVRQRIPIQDRFVKMTWIVFATRPLRLGSSLQESISFTTFSGRTHLRMETTSTGSLNTSHSFRPQFPRLG